MLNLHFWMKNLMKRFMLINLKDFLFKWEKKRCINLKKLFTGWSKLQEPGTMNLIHTFWKIIFRERKSEATLYVNKEHGSIIIVCIYVDDLLFTRNDVKMMQNFKQDMIQAYEMSDLGVAKLFLGHWSFSSERRNFHFSKQVY